MPISCKMNELLLIMDITCMQKSTKFKLIDIISKLAYETMALFTPPVSKHVRYRKIRNFCNLTQISYFAYFLRQYQQNTATVYMYILALCFISTLYNQHMGELRLPLSICPSVMPLVLGLIQPNLLSVTSTHMRAYKSTFSLESA